MKRKLGVLSLAAASAALLQSTSDAADSQPPAAAEVSIPLPIDIVLDKLIFSPPSQEQIMELLRGHGSHSSHSSHYSGSSSHSSHYSSTYSSHSSHSSHYSSTTYSAPSAPVYPYYPPSPAQPIQPTPPPRPPTDEVDYTLRLLDFKKKSAAKGLPSYQYELGIIYLDGKGVETNRERGMAYLEFASLQDHVEAKKRLKLALVLEAASSQIAESSTNSAGSTNTGPTASTAPVDITVQKLLRSAADGSADSQYELGLKYLHGEGLPKNRERGLLLLEMALIQGKAEAEAALRAAKSETKLTEGKKP